MAGKNTPAKTDTNMSRVRELFQAKVVRDEDADPELVQLRMVERIFGAESADDILNAGGGDVTHVRDALGTPFHIYDVDWQESTVEGDENIGVYAVIHATDMLTGEKKVLTCGGTNVCAALLALKERDFLPVEAKFIEASKKTARGYYPLWLTKLTVLDRQRIASGVTVVEEPF